MKKRPMAAIESFSSDFHRNFPHSLPPVVVALFCFLFCFLVWFGFFSMADFPRLSARIIFPVRIGRVVDRFAFHYRIGPSNQMRRRVSPRRRQLVDDDASQSKFTASISFLSLSLSLSLSRFRMDAIHHDAACDVRVGVLAPVSHAAVVGLIIQIDANDLYEGRRRPADRQNNNGQQLTHE